MQDKHDFYTVDIFSQIVNQLPTRKFSKNAERSRRYRKRKKEKHISILQEDIYCMQKKICQAQ